MQQDQLLHDTPHGSEDKYNNPASKPKKLPDPNDFTADDARTEPRQDKDEDMKKERGQREE